MLDESAWPTAYLNSPEGQASLRWALPAEFGGDGLAPLNLHLRYEALALQSLPLALIVSQRDAAVAILDASANDAARRRLLAEVRDGAFVTIGIAQLTTSRQRGAPAMTAAPVANGYRLTGTIPWATGAAHCRYIVAGASLPDGTQILVALPTAIKGVTIDPPLPLVAMTSTWTTQVRCEEAEVPAHLVLAGPTPNVLAMRRAGVRIPQAFLALGHSAAALDLIKAHTSARAEQLGARFAAQLFALRERTLTACAPNASPDPAEITDLRGRCNDLALRITHAAVALYKGTALLTSHPAQRLAREALFLLVWSCPDAVIDCTTNLLAISPDTAS